MVARMTSISSAQARNSDLGRPIEGAAWMLLSGLAFVGVNGVVKSLGTDLPAAQSAFIRFAFGLVFFLPVLPRLLRSDYPPRVWWLFGWRGALHVTAVIFWFYAMARVPVAEMSAIGFLNPIIVLVIAGLWLGERLTAQRLSVVALALLGALVVLRPGFREITPGHLAQIAATLAFAASYTLAKRLSLYAPAGLIVAVLSFTVTLGLLPLALWSWVPVSLAQLFWLGVVGALATVAHYAMARAFAATRLAVTQPIVFLQIVWAAALGSLVFNEPLDPWVIAGGGIIIAAISLNMIAEARRRRQAPPADLGVAP